MFLTLIFLFYIRLSGKMYDPIATRASCRECFLLDGSRAPPHYYNRSTWAKEKYDAVMAYLDQIFTPSDIAFQPFLREMQ